MRLAVSRSEFDAVPRALLVSQLLDARAGRAVVARDAVVAALRPLKTMTVADERGGVCWTTDDALGSRLTVTMSVREAIALVRVMGPISRVRADGPGVRLLCAIGLVSQHLAQSADRSGVGMRAALTVLKVAVDECMARCVTKPAFRPGRLWKKPPDASQRG